MSSRLPFTGSYSAPANWQVSSGRLLPIHKTRRSSVRGMPPTKYMNLKARERVRDWLLWYMERYKKTQADLERMTGVDNSAISRALSLRSLGFDVFAALMTKTKPQFDADRVLNDDAPRRDETKV